MKNLFLTIAQTGLTIGLLSSCTKEEGPENHNQNLPEGALHPEERMVKGYVELQKKMNSYLFSAKRFIFAT